MDPFLGLKLVHVLAAITALGANLTYTFWMRYAGDAQDRVVWTMQGIRRLDAYVANPAYVVVGITGVVMVVRGAYSFRVGWVAASSVLFVVVVIIGMALYSPALKRQIALAEVDTSSPAYAAAARRSDILGLLTLALVIVIVALMVTKPG